MNQSVLPSIKGSIEGYTAFFGHGLVSKKNNSEFKPAVLRLHIDVVLHPVCGRVVG